MVALRISGSDDDAVQRLKRDPGRTSRILSWWSHLELNVGRYQPTMARTTPGLDFLAWNLLKPSMLCLIISTASYLFSFPFTTWMLLVAPFLGTAAYIVGGIALNRWIEKLEATRMGSRVVPRHNRNYSIFDIVGIFGGSGFSGTYSSQINTIF